MPEKLTYISDEERTFKAKPSEVSDVMELDIHSDNLGRIVDKDFAQGPKGVKGPAEAEYDYREEHAKISALSKSLKEDDFDPRKHAKKLKVGGDCKSERTIEENLYKNIPWWKRLNPFENIEKKGRIWDEMSSIDSAIIKKKYRKR